QHRHLRKQLAVLERSRKPEPCDLVRLAAGDGVAAKPDLSLATVDAAHAIEHAGLAPAVRTNKREQLARCHGERDAAKHSQAAEAWGEAVGFQRSHPISGCGDIA